MAAPQREEFERRLLAMVRDQLEVLDRDWPHGWEITDFVVTTRFYGAREPEPSVEAWEGGPYPGWEPFGWTRGSSPSYDHDAELLQAALRHTHARIDQLAADDNGELNPAENAKHD
jgi:hypothetical protein